MSNKIKAEVNSTIFKQVDNQIRVMDNAGGNVQENQVGYSTNENNQVNIFIYLKLLEISINCVLIHTCE